MGRDTGSAAMNNSKTAQGLSTSYGANATANSNILTPTLNQMATAPQGFGEQTKANMNTAAEQSIGGANAGIVGQAGAAAARTNNAGAYAPAAAQAGHDATAQLSDAALGVQNKDAMLKEEQRSQGLQGLQNMYQTNVGAGENALGLSTSALNAKNAADEQTFNQWFKPFQMIAGNATSAGNAAMAGCWIAAELYGGWLEPRTVAVRKWIFGDFSKSWMGRLLASLYLRFGERLAKRIQTDRPLRWMFRKLFDAALRKAVK